LFVSVARGNARLYLSEHKGDARPDTLIHLYARDIDAVSEEFAFQSTKMGSPGGSATSRIRTATGYGSLLGALEQETPKTRASALV
jgi:hypothetical protein